MSSGNTPKKTDPTKTTRRECYLTNGSVSVRTGRMRVGPLYMFVGRDQVSSSPKYQEPRRRRALTSTPSFLIGYIECGLTDFDRMANMKTLHCPDEVFCTYPSSGSAV